MKVFKLIFTTTKVNNYFSNKDKTPHKLKLKLFYEYKCSYDESIKYIGFTSRPLVEKVKKHLKGNTAISDNTSNCNICKNKNITVNNFGILKKCRNKFETMISENLLIKRYNLILNKQLTKPGITHTLRIFFIS